MADNINIAVKVIDMATANLKAIQNQINSMTKTLGRQNQVMRNNFSQFTGGFKSISQAVQNTKFSNVNAELKQLGSQGTKQLFNVQEAMDNAVTKASKRMGSTIKKTATQAKSSIKEMRAQFLGMGFAMLFGGMALKRFSQTISRNLIKNFMDLSDESSSAVKDVMAVQAAFKFLQFTLFETFARTDMFSNLVNGLINLSDKLSEFIQKNPGLSEVIGKFLILGIVLGSLLMPLGQIALISTAIGAGFLGTIGVLFIVAAALMLIWSIFESDMSTAVKIVLSLATAFLSVLAIGKLTGKNVGWIGRMFIWLAKSPLFWIALALIALHNAVKTLGGGFEGLWNLIKAVGAGIVKVLIAVGRSMLDYFLAPIEKILLAAAKLADWLGANALARALGDWSQSVTEVRNDFDMMADSAIRAVDAAMGMGDIRAANESLQGSPAEVAKEMFLVGRRPDSPRQAVSDSSISDAERGIQEQKEALGKLSGGSSLQDLANLEKQANEQRAQLIELQKQNLERQRVMASMSSSTEF